MSQILPKEHISGGANVTKMLLKSWQFSKQKSYWDFLSILSDDSFTSTTNLGQK